MALLSIRNPASLQRFKMYPNRKATENLQNEKEGS